MKMHPFVKSGLIAAGAFGGVELISQVSIKSNPKILKNDTFESVMSEKDKKEVDYFLEKRKTFDVKGIAGATFAGAVFGVGLRAIRNLLRRK